MQKELIVKVLLSVVSITIIVFLYRFSKTLSLKFLKLFMSQEKAEDNVVYFLCLIGVLLFSLLAALGI